MNTGSVSWALARRALVLLRPEDPLRLRPRCPLRHRLPRGVTLALTAREDCTYLADVGGGTGQFCFPGDEVSSSATGTHLDWARSSLVAQRSAGSEGKFRR